MTIHHSRMIHCLSPVICPTLLRPSVCRTHKTYTTLHPNLTLLQPLVCVSSSLLTFHLQPPSTTLPSTSFSVLRLLHSLSRRSPAVLSTAPSLPLCALHSPFPHNSPATGPSRKNNEDLLCSSRSCSSHSRLRCTVLGTARQQSWQQ